jgi:hypothetical protein
MARYRLTALRTYEEASEKEKTTAPIRGRTPECKPIGDRKDTGFTIRREVDGSIIAKCYDSDLIRWYPDGRMFITNGGWPSNTTHDFIARLVGLQYWFCYGRNGETWLTLGPDREAFPLAKGGQFFTRHADGYLIAETPNYPITHVINKPAMQAARKEIAPFIKYFNNMMKLTQWAPMEGGVAWIPTTAVYIAMRSNDIEEWAGVMTWLVQNGTVGHWGYDPVTKQHTHLRYVSKPAVQTRITRVLLSIHRSKLLTKRTHTKGGFVKDAYKDYADD